MLLILIHFFDFSFSYTVSHRVLPSLVLKWESKLLSESPARLQQISNPQIPPGLTNVNKDPERHQREVRSEVEPHCIGSLWGPAVRKKLFCSTTRSISESQGDGGDQPLCRGAAISPRVQEESTIQYAACLPAPAQKGDPWIHAVCHTFTPSTLQCVRSNVQRAGGETRKEDVMLRMGFGDDVAAVDAASSSHFVPLSAMMRNRKVSDRPVPGESRGPEGTLLQGNILMKVPIDALNERTKTTRDTARKTDRRGDSAGSSPICSNASHWPLDMAFKD
ncbi:uncharacterized protein LOC119008276 isoform X5 [Xyrichtys novacula]|uniref:Uncharacterized protein LOC119008276 isoform X5 n=1 Tax=Xyrichtys novacula TaxID=13765 RepID=A0AAV1H867_XYRNO|nr:uncharacterized protein LOC119008276 isoform X5 [Xyrichtys novacula]